MEDTIPRGESPRRVGNEPPRPRVSLGATKRSSIYIAPHEIQARLLVFAAVFIFIYALILTLAPAARARSWQVDYNWSHWVGVVVWCAVFFILHRQVRRFLPDVDPYLLPIVALLSGWGLFTIWRLVPVFGFRQALWLLLSGLVVALAVRLDPALRIIRRYKYIFLTSGIILTALTLVFGINPEGIGPNLWLGCCGLYLQPSEPLKLLFLIYLAAYLADRLPLQLRLVPLIAPTAIVAGIAILLFVVQRDLGTASIFIFLYAITLYFAAGRRRILLISILALGAAGLAGYYIFDVVRLRVDAWLNPWLDPANRSFQIIQSLMAIANGGVTGRGPGLGSPGLVPVAISDFVYTAIAEETGLAGSLALLALLALFTTRGLLAALRSPDNFRRILAAGLTSYIAAQAILIIGGNTRLLPLTGVTLPFVSYGGSSLLTSFVALLLLLLISCRHDQEPAPLPRPQPILLTGSLLYLGFFALALTTGWWAVWRGPDLLTRTDNARRAIADRYVQRGSILDRRGQTINHTQGISGDLQRLYAYPDLSSVVGYTNPVFGQSGLEASLDPYLRGLQGNPASLIWLDHILYGQPPPGLDVRLSLDLDLQAHADFLLGPHQGAVVLIDAATGEVLAMASHPVFDANLLASQGDSLLVDPDSPLLNRAAQGAYPPAAVLDPFLVAAGLSAQSTPSDLQGLYNALGFFTAPSLSLPVHEAAFPGGPLRISPLQLALAASALSNQGVRPAPQLATAVLTPAQGWVILPVAAEPVLAFSPSQVTLAVDRYALPGTPFWQVTAVAGTTTQPFTWSVAGTMPDWQAVPVVVVVLLEEEYPSLAAYIASHLLSSAISP